MHSLLRRPAVALLTTTLAASVLGIAPAAYAADGNVTGAVTGGGHAIEDALVSLYVFSPDYGGYWKYAGLDDYTDVNGEYTIIAPEGQYRVGFRDFTGAFVPEYWQDASDVDDAETFTIATGAPAMKSADLSAAAHISGAVTAGAEVPLSGIEVIAWREVVENAGTPDEYVDYRYAESEITDEFGQYEIGGLPSGTFRVEFNDQGYFGSGDYATEYYNNQASLEGEATEDLVIASGAERRGINADLGLDAQIAGRVTDAAGDGLEDAEVEVETLSGSGWAEVGYDSTDADGNYLINALPAGTYRVRFAGEIGDDYAVEYWKNVGCGASATTLDLDEDESIELINAQLIVDEHDDEVCPEFANTSLPTISGPAVVGETLTASTGSWTPTPTEFYYEWFRDSVEIGGANGPTYVLTKEDLDASITVGVAAGARNSDYDYGYARSAPTARVLATAPVVTPPVVTPPVVTPPVVTPPAPVVDLPTALARALAAVRVSGKAKVGKTLKVVKLDLDVRTAVTYKFKWFAGTKAIKKATKAKLKVTKAMKGKKLSVKVTATAASTSKSVKIKVGKVK